MTSAATTLDCPPRREAVRRPLRMLLAEHDFTSRLVLHSFLSRYGNCDLAANGREAVEACRAAARQGERYDLVCIDLMEPGVDGIEAARQIRALEEGRGKIVMTTAIDGTHDVMRAYHELCDAWLMKPVDLSRLLLKMHAWNLVG